MVEFYKRQSINNPAHYKIGQKVTQNNGKVIFSVFYRQKNNELFTMQTTFVNNENAETYLKINKWEAIQ